MTAIYREHKEVKEVVTKKQVGTRCDWCGESIPDEQQCEPDFPRLNTDISFTVEIPCYDVGDARGWKVDDLCLACGERLKTKLIELGLNVVHTKWDW